MVAGVVAVAAGASGATEVLSAVAAGSSMAAAGKLGVCAAASTSIKPALAATAGPYLSGWPAAVAACLTAAAGEAALLRAGSALCGDAMGVVCSAAGTGADLLLAAVTVVGDEIALSAAASRLDLEDRLPADRACAIAAGPLIPAAA